MGRFHFCYFCKGNARIFVSIQRAAIKQRVGSVGFYERYKLACERLWKITLQAAWAAGIADVKCAFLITKISTRRQPLHAADSNCILFIVPDAIRLPLPLGRG